jgi:hypothetical protein
MPLRGAPWRIKMRRDQVPGTRDRGPVGARVGSVRVGPVSVPDRDGVPGPWSPVPIP